MEPSSMTYPGAVDKNGCFSRPDESEVDFCTVASSWAQSSGSWEYPPHIKNMFSNWFGVALDKTPLDSSSKGLMPWELACCWIDEDGRGSIQVRPSAGSQDRVPLDVVLVHEAIHAVRGRLDASRFEEHVAYAACKDLFPHAFPRWRAWIGPLFSSVREVIVLLVCLWGSWGLPLFLDTAVPAWIIAGLDALIISVFLVRLRRRWGVWNRAMKAITTHWPARAWRLMIRMADGEIEWLSMLPQNRVRESIAQKAAKEWRWRYFLDCILEA